MKIFLDESGNTGYKFNAGSSKFFVLCALIFTSDDDVNNCDQSIKNMRNKNNVPKNLEFHFTHNSDKQRTMFLKTLSNQDFMIATVVLNKDVLVNHPNKPSNKQEFYNLACKLLFESFGDIVHDATIKMDKTGNKIFQSELRKFANANLLPGKIKSFRQYDSKNYNLLQAADYAASIINRKMESKPLAQKYYNYLKNHELSVVIYP